MTKKKKHNSSIIPVNFSKKKDIFFSSFFANISPPFFGFFQFLKKKISPFFLGVNKIFFSGIIFRKTKKMKEIILNVKKVKEIV